MRSSLLRIAFTLSILLLYTIKVSLQPLFPIGLGGTNNHMEYKFIDARKSKIALAGMCLDNGICGAVDNIVAEVYNELT